MERSPRTIWIAGPAAGITLLASTVAYNTYAGPQHDNFRDDNGHRIRHVLLISIDGMHALGFLNCSKGIKGGAAYCPNLAALAFNGLNYLQPSTSKPSDSFPGLTAMVSGSSPRTARAFYDVAYDR
jgi:predicted AlkP superfamily pyrophosphatase or phosphodiesterase